MPQKEQQQKSEVMSKPKLYLWYESAFCFAVPVVVATLVHFSPKASWWIYGALEGRGALYSAIAGTAASMLGFVIAASAIVVGFVKDVVFEKLHEKNELAEVFAVFFQASWGLSACTLWSFVALVGDTQYRPHLWIAYVMFGLSLFSVFRIARCIWIIDLINRRMIEHMVEKFGEHGNEQTEQPTPSQDGPDLYSPQGFKESEE